MKKLIYCALALATGLFATSCQQESLEPAQSGSTVTYTVEMPQVATKAVGEADSVNNLVYAVYRVTNTELTDEQAKATLATASGDFQLMYQEDTPVTAVDGKKKAHISLELINDQRYVVIFWAQKGYTWFEKGQSFTSVAYPTTLDGNNDAYDAFTNVDVISVDGSVSKEITLVRPFAQLNIATVVPGPTTEYPDRYKDFELATTSVAVQGVAQSFNVGAQVGETVGQVTFTEAVPVDQQFSATHPAYISMNYVFVPANQSNVKVSYDINTNNYGTVNNTVPNVPVARNYRTNIVGNLLTSDVDYNVELAPWAENSNTGTTEVIVDGLIKNQNGDYEVYTAVGLAHAINHLFVDANGAANEGTFFIESGLYDMAHQAINDITVTSGTLKVYGSEAVVTRSSASVNSVTITGLKKAIINTVEDDATVFFSGITIQDFEGEANAAAFVQDNSGKVVLAGCDIVDENGNPDEETELVGGNDPIEVDKGEEAATDLIYTAEQLAAAFADATVKSIALGADIALENTLVFPEGKTATLDLRGWELTIADPEKVATTYALNNLGTLTIKDSYETGSVNARGIYNGYGNGGENVSNAKLTIEGGTFNALGTNGGAAVFNYGIVEIKGGNFTSIGGYSLNNQSGASMTIAEGVKANNGIYNNGATLTINGGNIEGNRSGCHVVYSWDSTVTINGGTIHNNNSGNSTLMSAGTSVMTVNDGTFSIKDGRVEGNGNTWTSCLTDTQNTARLTINGGTFNGGFRVQGGTTMEITDGIFNDVVGSGYNVYAGATVVITGGSYNYDVNKWCHKDYKAVKNDETAMWNVVQKVYTVQAGNDNYETLQEAVNAAEDGTTISLLTDIEQIDGVLITNKNITIDLNSKTFTVSEGANTNNRNFKVNGSSVVTIQNGTMIAKGEITAGAYGTVRTEDTAVVTLNNVESYSYRGYGLNIKANTGSKIIINNSEIYAQYSGGVEAAGGEIELNNVKIEQKGVYSSAAWCSVAIGVNGEGKVTVNSGEYSAAAIATDSNSAQGTWVAYVMSSGGTLDIIGGIFNGTVAETANAANACGLICADRAAVVNIEGGTFNSNGAILDMRNNVGTLPNPIATLYGGTFSADPTVSGLYSSNLIKVAEGYSVVKKDDKWIIAKPIATVGNDTYYGIDDAVNAWSSTNNSTLTLLDNVTLTDVITLKSTEYHVLDLSTYTMTAAKGKDAIQITAEGRSSASYALDIKADATNPGGITATGKAVVKTTGKSGVKDRPIIRFYNGVFTGTNVIYHSGSNGTNCPQFQFHGGVYNGTVYADRALIQFYGGTFHGSLQMSVDSSAYALISGGRFKSLTNQFGSALNSDKFTIGSAKGVYDRGIYVDDEGYYVVVKDVITDFTAQFEARVDINPNSYNYLYYSSAKDLYMYYTSQNKVPQSDKSKMELNPNFNK